MFAYCNNNPVVHNDVSGALHERTAGGGGKVENYQYIYSQNDPNVSGKRLGVSTVGQSGCGVVATYNALITLGNPKPFDAVLRYYNKHPSLRPLGGTIGMSPYAVACYFKDNGYRVILTDNNDGIDILSATADASILYSFYDKTYTPLGIKIEAVGHHFVEYHRESTIKYGCLNAPTLSGYDTFQYPSDYATNYVAILIYN